MTRNDVFGFYSPDPFSDDLEGLTKPSKTIDNIKTGSTWKDSKDGSIWRVTYKDSLVHLISLIDSKISKYSVEDFFSTFSLVEFGAVCYICKKKYPYAEKKYKFRCWACKNKV